jgi:hypothetical protein
MFFRLNLFLVLLLASSNSGYSSTEKSTNHQLLEYLPHAIPFVIQHSDPSTFIHKGHDENISNAAGDAFGIFLTKKVNCSVEVIAQKKSKTIHDKQSVSSAPKILQYIYVCNSLQNYYPSKFTAAEINFHKLAACFQKTEENTNFSANNETHAVISLINSNTRVTSVSANSNSIVLSSLPRQQSSIIRGSRFSLPVAIQITIDANNFLRNATSVLSLLLAPRVNEKNAVSVRHHEPYNNSLVKQLQNLVLFFLMQNYQRSASENTQITSLIPYNSAEPLMLSTAQPNGINFVSRGGQWKEISNKQEASAVKEYSEHSAILKLYGYL